MWELANITSSLHDAGSLTVLLYRRGVIKDLACMDRVARFNANCSHRPRFFLHYRKHSTYIGDDKRLMRAVLRFLSGRR